MTLLSKIEKGIVALLVFLLLLSGGGIIRAFYTENSELLPTSGGDFTEGIVGMIPPDYNFNPLFSDTGIEADVGSLVFSGLMRYNSETGEIEDHLALHTLSADKKVYEFTLKENLYWHDGQQVTSNDILYTFRDVIQHPKFPVELLKQAFSDVQIDRIDERTVRFTIPEKRKTFFTNFTVGLLPRHQLNGTSIDELIAAEFNQNPIGCGPFTFDGVYPNADGTTTIRLSAFDEYISGRSQIDTLSLRIFPTYDQLMLHLAEVDAIKPMRTEEAEKINIGSRFAEAKVISPRYLAVFFNMKDETLVAKKIRQAMRAAVDTNILAEKLMGKRVDTPLVELWAQDDIVNISKERAGELLNDAGYYFPGEYVDEEKEELKTKRNKEAKYITEPTNKLWYPTTEESFFLVGNVPEGTQKVTVNGYNLQLFSPSKGTFSYRVGARKLEVGENTVNIEFKNEDDEFLDEESIIIHYEPDEKILAEVIRETSDISKESISEETAVSEPEESEEPLFRTNENGEHVTLTLPYLQSFEYLDEIAQFLKSEWENIGIEIILEPLSPEDLRGKIKGREYQLLLMPQDLGYNIDPYPYFHLSQAKENGFNYSNWKNLDASVLLEQIRETHDDEVRLNALYRLRDIIIDDVPAIFLFTPHYSWFYDEEIKDVQVEHIVYHSDRFSRIEDIFMRESRQFNKEHPVSDFFQYFQEQSQTLFSFSQ